MNWLQKWESGSNIPGFEAYGPTQRKTEDI